jgi:endonuclease/exonuclease/phosphatase family metal-dependent hydrolase
MSYNVRHAILDEGQNAWMNRRKAVIKVIQSYEPAILGLQESTGTQHKSIQEALSNYEWVGMADNPGSGEHNPIGYTTRFDLEDTDTIWLSETPNTPKSIGWDANYPRVLTTAMLRDRKVEQSLTVFNTHFDHRGSEARRQSARLIRKQIDTIPHRQTIVVGDFNCSNGDTPYEMLTDDKFKRTVVDARYVAHKIHGPKTTLSDFTALCPDRRVDHIFVNSDFTVCRYVVCTHTDRDDRYPSDHLPVIVDILL